MAHSGAYTGPYFFSPNEYYIHEHANNIGRANGGQSEFSNLQQIFESHRKNALTAIKTEYKQMFLINTISDNGLNLMDALFEEDSDSILSELNKQMENALYNSLSIERMTALMSYQRDATKTIQNLLSSDAKIALTEFNKLIEILQKSSRLLGSEGKELAAALDFTYQRNIGLNKMGNRLQMALSKFNIDNEGASIEQQRVNKAVSALNALAKDFITGKTSTGTDITKKNIKQVVDKVFSLGFSEAIASRLQTTGTLSVINAIQSLAGTDTHMKYISNEQGLNGTLQGSKSAGKVDIQNNNVTFTIDSNQNIDNGNITINLGLSNKFYRTSHFSNLDKKKKIEFHSGQGVTLGELIRQLFGNDRNKYLAYNTMAKSEVDKKTVIALQDLLLVRGLNRLFASRGGAKDFAQFILVNGNIVSTWELIEYAINNNIGKSQSYNPENQAIVITIPEHKNITTLGSVTTQLDRVREVNRAINNASVQATIRVDKLKKLR